MVNNDDDLFGGMFDLNGDGKTSIDEEWIAFQVMNEIEKDSDETPHHSSSKSFGFLKEMRKVPPTDELQVSDVPAAPDEGQYRSLRKEYRSEIKCGFFLGTVLLAFPVLSIYAAIAGYDEKGDAIATVITVLFVLAGLAAAMYIIFSFYPRIRMYFLKLFQLRTNYFSTLPAERKKQYEYSKRKRKRVLIAVAGAAMLLFLLYAVIQVNAVASVYAKAKTDVFSEDYTAAQELLEGIADSGYKDAKSLLLLCKAHIEYSHGDLGSAYNKIKGASFYDESPEQLDAIKAFRSELEDAEDAHFQKLFEKKQ